MLHRDIWYWGNGITNVKDGIEGWFRVTVLIPNQLWKKKLVHVGTSIARDVFWTSWLAQALQAILDIRHLVTVAILDMVMALWILWLADHFQQISQQRLRGGYYPPPPPDYYAAYGYPPPGYPYGGYPPMPAPRLGGTRALTRGSQGSEISEIHWTTMTYYDTRSMTKDLTMLIFPSLEHFF